jgi:predicted phage terminase large subunit-like protein
MSSLPSSLTNLMSRPSLLEELKASVARESLKDFIYQAWSLVEPESKLEWNWHLDELCLALEAVTRGEIKRLIVNIPPGFSKSIFISVLWPAFEWASKPGLRYLTASYSDVNTIRDNRRLRTIVTSDWYKKHYKVELASDQWAKVRFDTTVKGWRIASSVEGTGTGEHPDRIIIDDPIKAEDASSEAERKKCTDWFNNTISTRVRRDPAIILVMQRLHLDDLSGHLLALGGWDHICFPMHYRETTVDEHGKLIWQTDQRDHRIIPGELLWPDVYTEEKVQQIANLLGAFGVAAQLEQDPIPVGGGLFKRDWFDFVDAAPIDADRCRGWDIAESDEKEKKGDWTVGVRLAKSRANGMIYVEDVQRDQKVLVDKLIESVAETDGVKCKIREGAGSGKAMIKARSILLQGYDYAASPETDSKIERANPFRAQCEARNVKIVRGDWNEAYLSVLTSFPVGKYDDDVDASSNAFNELVQVKKKVSPVWGRK